jgi:hypothetical protein
VARRERGALLPAQSDRRALSCLTCWDRQPVLCVTGTQSYYSIPSFLIRYRSARKLMPSSFAAAVLL